MKYSDNEISTYLFCAQLPQTKTNPLTIIEWNVVVKSLGDHKLEPEVLLTMNTEELSNILTHATAAQKKRIVEKIEKRRNLGISMVELDEVTKQGYGIMFRANMPKRLKKLTSKFLPPFFYYAGDPSIFSHVTLGVVGARDASQEELDKTAQIAKEAAKQGVVIISGGARGVDTTAVEAALQNGGKAVVFPVDGLSKWVKKTNIRTYLMNGQLLLMSTQQLNATFTASYAMKRNQFIHAPSDMVLVASSKISGKKTSGTWEGVQENLKMKWSPIYVIGESEGVKKLLAEGNAKPFTTFDDILKDEQILNRNKYEQFDLNAKKLIKFAINNGMERQTIEDKFENILNEFFDKVNVSCGETVVKSSETHEAVQLSIEDLIKEESN